MRPQLLPTIVSIGLLGFARVAPAQDQVETLDEAAFIAALQERDPRVLRLAAEVAGAEADATAANTRVNPTLALDREEVFSGGGIATNYARLSWPVDLAGQRSRRLTAARARARAAAAAVETSQTELVIDGLRTFYQVAYARQHVAVLRADRESLARAVEIVRNRASAGAASGYEVQRIELELAAYDDALASAEDEHARDRAELGARLGLAAVEASSDLALPVVPAAAETLAAGAVEARGDYRAASLRAESADQLVALARRGWIPELAVSAGAMTAEVGDRTAFGYTLGVTLSLPVFDRGQGDGARAVAARRIADADRRVLDATIPARIRSARAALARRVAQAERLATHQLSRLDALLAAAETGYREGETGLVELLDAYRTARTMRTRDLELRRDARLAELDLWLALGHRP